MNHDTGNILDAFEIKVGDVKNFMTEFSLFVMKKGKISLGIEEILIKLNTLEGKEKQAYWNTMLFFMLEGLESMVKKHNEKVVECMCNKTKEKDKE